MYRFLFIKFIDEFLHQSRDACPHLHLLMFRCEETRNGATTFVADTSPGGGFIFSVKSAGRDIACEGQGTLGGEVGEIFIGISDTQVFVVSNLYFNYFCPLHIN